MNKVDAADAQAHFALPPKQVWIDRTSYIKTDIDTLYACLVDVENWPSWTPGLKSIKRFDKGALVSGSFFLMTLEVPVIKSLLLPSTVYTNTKNKIEWGGGALGSVIRHSMELTYVDENTTQLRHVEYATGLLALLTRPVAKFAHRHDMNWSDAIEAKFNS